MLVHLRKFDVCTNMLQINEKLCSNEQTEIRKLKPSEFCNLAMILNVNDDWKTLMSIVPKDRNSQQFKFNNDHIFMIEQASKIQNRSCAEIFLEEWGTMGKVRPTVETLLELLIKAELYRAADFININILKRGPVKRPDFGPAARVANLSSLFADTDDDDSDMKFNNDHLNSDAKMKLALPNNYNDGRSRRSEDTNKRSEYNQEQLDFNNKTTKRFDDIETLCSKTENLMQFSEMSDHIRVVAGQSIELRDGAPEKHDQQSTMLKIEPKIPVFINDSVFTDPAISKEERKKTSNDSTDNQLINNMKNIELTHSLDNCNDNNENVELVKEVIPKIPIFLSSSSLSE